MEKIVIGVAPTKRDIFSLDDALKQKKSIFKKLKEFDCEIVDIDDISESGILERQEDVDKIAEKFRNIDGLFIPHCDFGSEGLVSRLAAKLKKPVLLWGPADDYPMEDGTITRYTQCGIFATGKVLQRFDVPFTYIVNSTVDSKKFTNGFARFIAVCAAVKAFYSTRILQVSTRPKPFWSVIVNEGELIEKFGIEVVPITLYDVKVRMDAILADGKNEDFIRTVSRISQMDCTGLGSQEAVRKIAALKTALKELVVENGCNCAAVQCWDAMQDMMGVMPCMSDGLLTEEGIPVVCETDIHGAITSRMLSAAAGNKTTFISDMTMRHPEKANLQLMWHCGNFSPSLCEDISKARGERNMILASQCPGVARFTIKEGPLTITRFDGVKGQYKLFIGQAKAVAGPDTAGTHTWIEVPDLDKWEYKLVTGPYIHHCIGVYDSVAAVMYEACKYIPGLEADPADPTEEEIFRTWLEG